MTYTFAGLVCLLTSQLPYFSRSTQVQVFEQGLLLGAAIALFSVRLFA